HQAAVAGEHADFQHPPRARKPHKHLQELPFDSSDLHLRRLHLAVRLFAQTAKKLGFRFRVIVRKLLDSFIYKYHSIVSSMLADVGYLRFHLVPCGVSSSSTPRSASWLRISSARLKSRFLRAALRSTISDSTSAASCASTCSSAAPKTPSTLLARSRKSRTAWRSSVPNSPASIAMFTSRRRSCNAASAPAVFRSSFMLDSNSSRALAMI